MQLRITIAMCMVVIRNRKSLQSKVNICKSDVKIGDYADSLLVVQSAQYVWPQVEGVINTNDNCREIRQYLSYFA